MGWRNRSWQTKGHRDRSGRPSHPPPPPPPYYHEYNHHPVPLWEREFCSYVGTISWQRFCENKKFVPMYKNIEQWDDTEAFENFQNVKARFWANYHGLPSDIPLPDRDMYIDEVDHHCEIDPELVADLDKVHQPFEMDNDLVPAAGLGNTEADNNCTQNQSGNWDIYVEKPAEVNKWEENSRSSLSWGVKHEPFNKWSKISSGWGDALVKPNWDIYVEKPAEVNKWEDNSRSNLSWGVKHESFNKWCKDSSGWGEAPAKPNWGSSANNHYSSNNRSSFYGVSNNRCQDQSSISGRKRNSGVYFQQRNNKHRNQAEGYQRSRWQDHRGRNSEWFPFDSRPNGQGINRT